MFLYQFYQQRIIKNYQNFLVNDLKDQFVGMNIKEKERIKMQQMDIDIFSNQTLLGLTDYLCKITWIETMMQNNLNFGDIIYQKV